MISYYYHIRSGGVCHMSSAADVCERVAISRRPCHVISLVAVAAVCVVVAGDNSDGDADLTQRKCVQ